MRQWNEVWSFDTPRLHVALEVMPCDDDPADQFEFQEDIDAVRNGDVAYFDARVIVRDNEGRELGSDYLCGNAYNSVKEFYTSHRDPDPMNRNCSVMRAKQGENVCICHYFPDMVAQAVDQARTNMAMLRALNGG